MLRVTTCQAVDKGGRGDEQIHIADAIALAFEHRPQRREDLGDCRGHGKDWIARNADSQMVECGAHIGVAVCAFQNLAEHDRADRDATRGKLM